MAGSNTLNTFHMDHSKCHLFMTNSDQRDSVESENLQNFLANISDYMMVYCPYNDSEAVQLNLVEGLRDSGTMKVQKIFGDIKAESQRDLVMKVLDFSVKNGFGRWEQTTLPTDYSQCNLLQNIKEYLDDQGISQNLDSNIENGHCFGLSTLWAYHMLTGREEDFYKDLELIAGGELLETTQERKNEIEHLAGQMIFLQSFLDLDGIPEGLEKLKLISNRDEIKNCHRGFMFTAPFSANESGVFESLSKLLKKRLVPNEKKFIDVKIPGHACGVFSNGKQFYFYDPNNSKLPQGRESVEELVEDIVKNLLEADGTTLNLSLTEFSTTKQQKENYEDRKKLLQEILEEDSGNKDLSLAIFNAAYSGDKEMLEILFEKEENPLKINSVTDADLLPIYLAAQRGFGDVVKILYEKGGSVENESTLLYHAIDRDRAEVLKVLNDLGVDLGRPMGNGFTPLQHAINERKTDLIKTIVKLGVDPKASVFEAVENGSIETIKLFKSLGVNLKKIRNDKGWSLLHTAVGHGKRKVVNFLCKDGANPYEQTVSGETSLAIALKYGFENIYSDLLMQ